MELPNLLARADVVSARVSRRPVRRFAVVRPDDRHPAINGRRGIVRDRHLDHALVAESWNQRAGFRIQRDHLRTGGREQSSGCVFVSRPVRDSALRDRKFRSVRPQFFAGFRFERDHAMASRDIHHASDHDRRHFRKSTQICTQYLALFVGAKTKAPHLFEPGNVGRIDLLQWRVARPREIAIVHRPIAIRSLRSTRLGLLPRSSTNQRDRRRAYEDQRRNFHSEPPTHVIPSKVEGPAFSSAACETAADPISIAFVEEVYQRIEDVARARGVPRRRSRRRLAFDEFNFYFVSRAV